MKRIHIGPMRITVLRHEDSELVEDVAIEVHPLSHYAHNVERLVPSSINKHRFLMRLI